MVSKSGLALVSATVDAVAEQQPALAAQQPVELEELVQQAESAAATVPVSQSPATVANA